MLFNSLPYVIYLPLVFLGYWFVFNRNIKIQNLFLIAVSYVFYAWWDWRFLGLILASSFVDYIAGQKITAARSDASRKVFLWLSIFFNLSILGLFKYYNFFVDSLLSLLGSLGYEATSVFTISIILPIGISFYTFQTMSYTIDVYNGKVKSENNLLIFFAFVSFFPQLVAGPIERAARFLPQFKVARSFDLAKSIDGCRQILWGFFKKVAIADVLAVYVDQIFIYQESLCGGLLLMGAIFFAIQIYCDFSGYSDIGIGTAKLFGFDLMDNFRTPYFSTSTTELWRRWHISLGQWVNAYVFSVLALKYRRKLGKNGIVLAILITFLLIGLWHGANWTYVVFGLMQGMIVAVEYRAGGLFYRLMKHIPSFINKVLAWLITALIWLVCIVFFRSNSVSSAMSYLHKMLFVKKAYFQDILTQMETIEIIEILNSVSFLILPGILIFFIIEWKNRMFKHGLGNMMDNKILRYICYLTLLLIVVKFFFSEEAFIYFQF